MIHRILCLLILCTSTLLFGCANKTEIIPPSETILVSSTPLPTKEPTDIVKRIEEFYPIVDNTTYYYEGYGNEYASYDVFTDYSTNNAVQERVSNGGTTMARVIKIENGTIKKIYSQGESYYRENCLDKNYDVGEIILMEPLKPGTTWLLEDGRSRSITSISSSVDTPLGIFQAVEVTTESENGISYDYYSKGVGLIKSVYKFDDYEVTSTLKRIVENSSLAQNIVFYYPSLTKELQAETKTIIFHTNDITKLLLETAYKELPINAISVFSQKTRINTLYLNNDGNVVIDLNNQFIADMILDPEYEKLILQCVADTFGLYYGAQKVFLTIDNNAYQSENLTLEKGTYLTVSAPSDPT